MRKSRLAVLPAILLTGVLALSACESPEERAESHYRTGMELLAEGDSVRAELEFRNALEASQRHNRARLEYARLLTGDGRIEEALGQYQRLVENDARNGTAHLELAALAIRAEYHPLASKHVRLAFELMPDDIAARAQMAGVELREGDPALAVELATGVLAEAPDNIPAQLVMIADRIAAGDLAAALERTDTALRTAPEDQDLHLVRLTVLQQLGDIDMVGQQLERMLPLFPDDDGIIRSLVQWRLAQGNEDGALEVLRTAAERHPSDPVGFLNVAQFLLSTRGSDAARAELQHQRDTQPDPGPYLRALAELDFAEGRRDEAIASLQALVEGKEASPEVRDLQVTLAGMLLRAGRTEEADALVDTVLMTADRHVGALKLRARRHIRTDHTELALQDLNVALMETPGDPEVMTIMAEAHEREGAHDLAGQRLARAVEASDYAPPESYRFASFLLADGRLGQAESTILDALRRQPENVALLTLLARVHIEGSDWTRARQVASTLRQFDAPNAKASANSLDLAILQAEGRDDDAVALIESTAQEEDVAALTTLAAAQLAAGNYQGAKQVATKLLARDPASEAGRLLLAEAHAAAGEPGEAEALLRALIAEAPQSGPAYLGLFGILSATGRDAEAGTLLDQGIAATERGSDLLGAKASLLFDAGDFDGAIALYEEIYARDTSNVVVANNLASLLGTYRDDTESLERAFQIARRLRGSANPYFQDTYGWILTRRGDSEQALRYLEPAAAALGDDAMTQYHLGMTYLALERWDEARSALARAIGIAGADSPLPQIGTARARIAEIEARGKEPDGG